MTFYDAMWNLHLAHVFPVDVLEAIIEFAKRCCAIISGFIFVVCTDQNASSSDFESEILSKTSAWARPVCTSGLGSTDRYTSKRHLAVYSFFPLFRLTYIMLMMQMQGDRVMQYPELVYKVARGGDQFLSEEDMFALSH